MALVLEIHVSTVFGAVTNFVSASEPTTRNTWGTQLGHDVGKTEPFRMARDKNSVEFFGAYPKQKRRYHNRGAGVYKLVYFLWYEFGAAGEEDGLVFN